MATQVQINGIFMTINLPKHLFMAISYKLMTIKIVLNEVYAYFRFLVIKSSYHKWWYTETNV